MTGETLGTGSAGQGCSAGSIDRSALVFSELAYAAQSRHETPVMGATSLRGFE